MRILVFSVIAPSKKSVFYRAKKLFFKKIISQVFKVKIQAEVEKGLTGISKVGFGETVFLHKIFKTRHDASCPGVYAPAPFKGVFS